MHRKVHGTRISVRSRSAVKESIRRHFCCADSQQKERSCSAVLRSGNPDCRKLGTSRLSPCFPPHVSLERHCKDPLGGASGLSSSPRKNAQSYPHTAIPQLILWGQEADRIQTLLSRAPYRLDLLSSPGGELGHNYRKIPIRFEAGQRF